MIHATSMLAMLALLVQTTAASELIIAHRGASKFAQENTLAAYQKAVELKAAFVETDVQLSSDGELVMVHDSTKLSLSELRAKNVPTLTETLAALKGKPARLIVELKVGNDAVPGIEERVLALIDRFQMRKQTVLKSFDRRILARLKDRAPDIPQIFVFVLAWPSLGFLISTKPEVTPVFDVGAEYLQGHIAFLSQSFVSCAHARGYKVIAWSVDSSSTLAKARALGVDGVETDDPTLSFGKEPAPHHLREEHR